MLKNFLSFLAVFTLSSATRLFTLILQSKGKSQGKKPVLKVTKELCFQVFSTDGKTVWIVEFIIAHVCWTLTGWHVFILMYSCSNIREHLEQWQVNVNVIHNDVFWKTQTKRNKHFLCFYKILLCVFFVFIKYFYVHNRRGISIVCFTIIVYIIYVFNLSSMNACLAHHTWDSYMTCLKLTVVCSGSYNCH